MLTAPIQLSDGELKSIVTQRCSPFGTVKSIRIVRHFGRNGRRFAFVEMSTAAATKQLRNTVGDTPFGNSVVIRLQEPGSGHAAAMR